MIVVMFLIVLGYVVGAASAVFGVIASMMWLTIFGAFMIALAVLLDVVVLRRMLVREHRVLVGPNHGLSVGDGPMRFSNSAGKLPDGMVAGADYYVTKIERDEGN